MKHTGEREIKLRAASGFVLPVSLGDPIAPRTFSSTYHDTPDHRLANTGFTLRYRAEEGSGAWQLKLPENGHRLELELPGSPELVPPHFGDLVSATTRGRPLAPVATLDTSRKGVMVRDKGRDVAEVVLDRVAVSRSGRKVSQIEELEVELVEGDEQSLRAIEQTLRAAGAEPGDGRPKLARALGLPRWKRKPLRRDASPIRHLTVMLEKQYWAILEHDPGTRLGDDPEHLHQHRVAIRRLRALLRAAKPMLDAAWVKELRAELAWAGGALGDVRDLDVLLDHLRADAGELPLDRRLAFEAIIEAISARRGEARERMLRTLRSARYLRLLDRLERDLADPPTAIAEVPLASIVRKELRRLRREVRALGPNPTDDQLHEVRKTVKHARYAAELAERSCGSEATKYIVATKQLQDVLGEHQDAHVAEETIRGLAADAPPAVAYAAGMVAQRQRERRRQARAELPAAWKAVRKRGRAAWS